MSLSKPSTSAVTSVSDYFADVWMRMCKRWGIRPVPLVQGLSLWLGWSGLTWLAFGLSLVVVEVGERGDISLAEGLLGGSLIGLAQWVMIRRHLQRAYRWIAVSALGWGWLALFHIGALGWIAPDTLSLTARVWFGLLYGFYVGLVLGLGQWWVMRQSIARAWRWALLSAGIWSVSMAFGWLIGGCLRRVSDLFVAEVFGLAVAWGLTAALSGVAVVGMVYQLDNR